jgi:hypothetical protein
MRELDKTVDKNNISNGEGTNNWEKNDCNLTFQINGKSYNVNLYEEMLLECEDTMTINEVARKSCSDAIFWGGVTRKVQTKLDKFKEIEYQKWESFIHKWARLMCVGEDMKATAAEVNSKKIEAFSRDLLPSPWNDEEFNMNVKYYIQSVIRGLNKERDFIKNPIQKDELKQYTQMVYFDIYDIREVNFEMMKEFIIKLEEQQEILDLVTKLMSDKRTTLISTISNNIRSEQNLFGREGYKEAVSQFNKVLREDPEFKKIIKEIANK